MWISADFASLPVSTCKTVCKQKCLPLQANPVAQLSRPRQVDSWHGRWTGHPSKEEDGRSLRRQAECIPASFLLFTTSWLMGTCHLCIVTRRGHIIIKKLAGERSFSRVLAGQARRPVLNPQESQYWGGKDRCISVLTWQAKE